MPRRQQLALILTVTAIVVAIRVTAPSDLATGDQPYQVEYIGDVVTRGNWVAQHLRDGTPATKPPLYNWLAAPLILLTGWSGDFALKLPSVLAGIALAFVVWDVTRRIATERAATIAALLLVTTTMYVKLVYFARTDMLLALFMAKEHRHILYYIPHFAARMAPASLFAIVAIVSRESRTRRDGVLLAVCWVVAMLVCLSLVPSKRADRLFPLLPGACALAGWAIDSQLRGTRALMNVIAAIVLGAGAYAASGTLGGGGVQLAGVALAMLAVGMFAARRFAFAFLIAALLVINGVYQHRLSEPAKHALLKSDEGEPRQLDRFPRRHRARLSLPRSADAGRRRRGRRQLHRVQPDAGGLHLRHRHRHHRSRSPPRRSPHRRGDPHRPAGDAGLRP